MLPAAVPSLPSAPAALATGPEPLRHWLHWGAPLALTALAYAAVAVLVALAVALPADQASPLNPAPGIALASVLVYGRRMLLGVAAGFGAGGSR